MKVSVCIPVYGVEKYIERCARSLFEQTMKDDIEFIFVDDCTPDKSIEVLQKVLEEYPARKNQVKIIRHKVNKGVLCARKTALQHVSGDYIIHCDSDDWVDTNLYETMYKKAIEEQAAVVCCGIIVEQAQRQQKLIIKEKKVKDLLKNSFLSIEFNSLFNKMFLRSIACSPDLNIPDNITMAEDLLLTTQMLLKCEDLVSCPDVGVHYFYNNPNSLTLNFSQKAFASSRKVLEILIEKLSVTYPELADTCRGQILFSALRTPDISVTD